MKSPWEYTRDEALEAFKLITNRVWFVGSFTAKNAFPRLSKFTALSKLGELAFQTPESPWVDQKWHLRGNPLTFPLTLGLPDKAFKKGSGNPIKEVLN